MLGIVAIVLGFAGAGAHVWYQYNLGGNWVINNGTYTAVTEMWFGILIVEALLGWFWLLSIVLIGPRARDGAASQRHLRAFSEFWLYLLVAFPVLGFVLVRGGVPGLPYVPTEQWGGLFLTLVVASVGIAASFPIGIVLALGRRSELPIILPI